MIICNHCVRAATLAALTLLAIGCDSGRPSRTPDEFASDSALAADLALANRDTLLVDSIGEYRPPDAAERDTLADTTLVAPSGPATASGGKLSVAQPGTQTPIAAPTSPPGPANAAATPTRAPTRAAPRFTGTRACSSPTAENQSECMRAQLAAVDSRLNRIYRALITEMRRQENVRPGTKDPPSVQRLRVSQRAWLVYRDNECRRRGRGREGALWARPRARCLGEFAGRRANELADNFSRLTAH
ncbi:MAG: lysozyme inhibitor LprI family protein [Gemmatimonadaceae bacterium]|nr:lysozyme inhibitor LprI family protein [Gemmatimonadaceae bacterium]